MRIGQIFWKAEMPCDILHLNVYKYEQKNELDRVSLEMGHPKTCLIFKYRKLIRCSTRIKVIILQCMDLYRMNLLIVAGR